MPAIETASVEAQVARRRGIGYVAIAALLALDVYATGILGGSERTLAVVRSIVLPGLPFLEWHPLLGATVIAAALAAVGAWLRWGIDWLPVSIMIGCVAVAEFAIPVHHHDAAHTPEIVGASHEFTVVLVVFALVGQLRLLVARLPGADRVRRWLPAGLFYPAVSTARAAAIELLADPASASARRWLHDPFLYRRARRVSAWARFRFQRTDCRGAHAPLRAALSLCGSIGTDGDDALRSECRARLAGVPDSEPTWVRPLDGMLVALALARLAEQECVDRWRAVFDTRFALRHGRRPAALHTPSMLSVGTARTWEHAAATALAHRAGWIDAGDWPHLRRGCLAAAAGRRTDPDTLRLVAAGRLWATLTRDEEATVILSRRTLGEDPVARALQALALAGDGATT